MKKFIIYAVVSLLTLASYSQQQKFGDFKTFRVGGANVYSGSKSLTFGGDTTTAAKVLFGSIYSTVQFVNYRLGLLYNNIQSTAMTTLTATATLDFTSTSAQSSSAITIAVAGASPGDVVAMGHTVNPPSGTEFLARVTAPNFVTVVYINLTASAQDPDSGTFKVTVFK